MLVKTPDGCGFVTPAEYLIDLAEFIQHPSDTLVTTHGLIEWWKVEQCRLALAFDAMPASFKFRAIAEEWSAVDIVREMY